MLLELSLVTYIKSYYLCYEFHSATFSGFRLICSNLNQIYSTILSYRILIYRPSQSVAVTVLSLTNLYWSLGVLIPNLVTCVYTFPIK